MPKSIVVTAIPGDQEYTPPERIESERDGQDRADMAGMVPRFNYN